MKDDDEVSKYRIRISDIEYNKLTEVKLEAICNHCEKTSDYKKLKVFNVVLPLVTSVLVGSDTCKVWLCTTCKKENNIKDTIISESVLKEPYWLGVIPRPPRRKDGLQDRGAYDRKMTQWAYTFASELEQATTKFREDYKENKAEFDDFMDDIDGGEIAE